MRKLTVLLLLIFTINTVYSLSVEPTPYGAFIDFDAPEGSVYVDLYIDNAFIARLDSSERKYSIESLDSDTEYLLSVAYRDSSNGDISAEFERFTTTNWSGEYLWENRTDKDNKGRVREIRFRVKTVTSELYGQYNEIYMMIEGSEYRLFPLFDLGQEVSWVDYDDSTPQAITYRTNAEKFNKSNITPTRWRLEKIEVSPVLAATHVDTRAFGLKIKCVTRISFFLDSEGRRNLSFMLSGPSILRSFLFYSPNGESPDGAFHLVNLSDV